MRTALLHLPFSRSFFVSACVSLRNPYRVRVLHSHCSLGCMDSIKLSDGGEMPAIGFGTWKIARDQTASLVESALRIGYRSLDCACDYGNEKEVGEGIKSAVSKGIVQRSDIFVTSKLWNTYHAKEHVFPALKRTLSDLGLEYLDLYMIHFPISLKYVPFENRYPPEWKSDSGKLEEVDVPIQETWEALERAVDEGLVRHIGVCNFPSVLLTDLFSYARIKPSVLQIELHPYLQQHRLLAMCARKGIKVTAYSPLGAPSYIELDMDRNLGQGALEDEVIKKIAKETGKSCAQVLLKWGLQRGTAVIPKTSKIERLEENLNLADFSLTEEHMAMIKTLDKGMRFNDPGVFCEDMGMSIPIYD